MSIKFFDIHSDMLYDLYMKKIQGIDNRFNDFHIPQIKASDIKAALWTMYSPNDFDLIEAVKIAISEIDFDKIPDFKVMFGLEGLRNLKSYQDIQILYDLGFRHAMLTWNEENKYATGVAGPANSGLKEEGKKLLKKMEELDMIIDVAHLNEKSFFDVLNVSTKNIIYSHGNVKYICDHRRNVTLEQMRALKEVDGLLGLTLANGFVSSNKEEQDLNHFMDHVDEAVKVMGVNNVCFGFDFMDYLSEFPNSNIHDVNDATKVHLIAEAMFKRGYKEEDIKKICYTNFSSKYKNKLYKE